MFGQTSANSNPTHSILRNNNGISSQPPDHNRTNNILNLYRRRLANNNNISRTNTNQQLPQNNIRTDNNQDNNSILEITNGMNQNDNETNNPSPELSSDELSLPNFSYDSPNTNREGNSYVNNTTPSVHRNPTSRELISILNNLPNTPDNRIARNRLLHLANSNSNQSRNNRPHQQELSGLQGRRDFIRASELITNNTNNVRQNNNNNANRNTVITPQNRQHVIIDTTPEETDNRGVIPRDKHLIPVREACS